jgi:phage host-nuclease inhibitor protein Gam
MAAKTQKVKQSAVRVPVPQSRDQANDAIRRIGELSRERARIEADMNDHLAALKETFETQAEPLKAEVDALSEGLQTWCEAHRQALLPGAGKTASFPAGEVSWRVRPPKCLIKGVEAVIDGLKRLGLGRFVRTKEEINREAIINEAEAVRGVAGISIEQGEDFIITPYEVELAEVAK